MIVEAQPLAKITETAIRILCQEVGVVNTIRFLNQFTTGYGNYTADRDELVGHLTVADITAEIKRTQMNPSETSSGS